jgi:hypothetical protein
MKTSQFFLLFCAILLSSQLSYAQGQANLSAKKDNTLYEDATGAWSNGIGMHFFAGKTSSGLIRRGLIAFDIAGNIPAGAVIDSVKLRLSMSLTNTNNGAQRIELHPVLADWGEGTSNALPPGGSGVPATPGDATWKHRFFSMIFWTRDGGDFATTASASQTVNNVGIYFWNSTPLMVADVQAWLNTPANNFGWLVLGNENASQTAKRFDTREHTSAANRPLLTVFYHTPTRVENKQQNLPATFRLAQNYPNPLRASAFNPSTTIRFYLPAAANATLQILDLNGREMETLLDGKFSAGEHQAQWNAEKYAGGIYLYRLRAGNYSATKKLVLMR